MAQMRSRREQVEAHRFITSRMNQALVLANPDSIERPLRRIGVSIFASFMVMVVIFGGFAVATLFGKGNDAPMPNHIILVKETNSVYVYVNQAGTDQDEEGDPLKLWPVTNYTSALLMVKEGSNGEPPVQKLKSSSLKGIPRGNFTVGIQGIPSEPPDPKSLLQTERWNACSIPRRDSATSGFQLTQLLVQNLEDPDVWIGNDHWLLAKTAVNEEIEEPKYFLLWNDRKFSIDDGENTVQLINDLGFQLDQAVPINENVLSTLPSPAPILPPSGQDFGTDSQVETETGDFVMYGQPVESSGDHYVLTHEGGVDQFAPIGDTMVKLLASKYDEPVEVAAATRSEIGNEANYQPEGYPDVMLSEQTWAAVGSRPGVCVVYDPTDQGSDGTDLSIALYDAAPDYLVENARSVTVDEEGEIFSKTENLKAQTVLPPGTAVLADARTNPGATIGGFTYMVDSLGYRYGIGDEGTTDSTQRLLGYANVDPISVPHLMIELIPEGPNLNPNDARQQIFVDADEVPVFESEAAPSEGEGG